MKEKEMNGKQDGNGYWIHQGHNLQKWRKAKGMGLEMLAREAGMSPEEIFQLEMSRVIDDAILRKMAAIFSISPESLKETKELMPLYESSSCYYTTFTNNGSVNGVNENGGSHWQNPQLNSYPTIHPLDKVVELYERIVAEDNKRIKELEKKLSELSENKSE